MRSANLVFRRQWLAWLQVTADPHASEASLVSGELAVGPV